MYRCTYRFRILAYRLRLYTMRVWRSTVQAAAAANGIRTSGGAAKYGRFHRRSDLKFCRLSVGIVTVFVVFALCFVTLLVYSYVSRYDQYRELSSYDAEVNGLKSNFGFLPNVTGAEANKVLRFGHGLVARGLDSRYWDRDDKRRDGDYDDGMMEHRNMDSRDKSRDKGHESREARDSNNWSTPNDPSHNSQMKRVGLFNEARRNELKLYEEQYKASLKNVYLSNENRNRNNFSDDDNRWKQAETDDEYDDRIDSHDVHAEDYDGTGNEKEKQYVKNKVIRDSSDFQGSRGTVSNVAKVGDEISTNSFERHTFLSSHHFDLGKKNSQHIDEDDDKTVRTPRLDQKRKPRRRKRSGCAIKFLNSAAQLVEPLEGRKFARFSLQYTKVEEEPAGEEHWEPRFAGHQTLEKREQSFLAHDQKINCGFVKGPKGYPSTGFDLKEGDLNYISRCHIAVSSCIFANSDRLRAPAGNKITRLSKRNVCFVMFVDKSTLNTLSSEGQMPDRMGFIGLWKIVVVKNLPFTDMHRVGKVPKLLSHRLFPSARYSIWLDSKLRLQLDPLIILEYFLWRKGYEYAISNHYDRHCIWEEVERNKKLNKYNHTAIDKQFNFYQADGLQRFHASDPNKLLPSNVPEGSFIVRAHTPMSNLFSCLWFNEVDRFTPRDQLSFFYTYQKLRKMNPDKPFHLHMFKDCERRAVTKLFHYRSNEKRNAQAVG